MTWRRLVLFVLVACVSDAHLAAAKLASYREYPYGGCRFVQEQFGATPDKWQEQLLVAAVDPKIQRISLQACAGPGKTCGESWVGWLFLATRVSTDGSGYEHPKGLATSITGDNLRDNLWAELAKWQARSEFLSREFKWTAQRIFQRQHEATWFLAARNWPKSGSVDEQGRTFSGLHGKNVLVLVDESGAIPSTILRAAEQALPNTHWGKVLQGGNPISREGMLYEAQMKAHLWHIVRVTGDPDDPDAWVHSPRVDIKVGEQQTPAEWAREQIQTYGRDNPWVQAYILGQFPPTSLNTLLSVEDVLAAQARVIPPAQFEHMQKRLGVDVARFGDDRSVIFARQGLNAHVGGNNPVVMRTARTTDIAARVWTAIHRWHAELTFVDDTGHWGHGVIDNLIAAGLPSVHPVIFHGKAIDPRYRNKRAEMWFAMADAIKGGASLPPHIGELVGELSTPQYTFVNGAQVLEDKEFVKKRLGRSPDLADALALTYALPDMPGDVMKRLQLVKAAQQGTPGEWDPFKSTT